MMPAHIVEKQEPGIADITKLTLTSPVEELKKAGDYWTNKFKDFDPATMPGSGPTRSPPSTPTRSR